MDELTIHKIWAGVVAFFISALFFTIIFAFYQWHHDVDLPEAPPKPECQLGQALIWTDEYTDAICVPIVAVEIPRPPE